MYLFIIRAIKHLSNYQGISLLLITYNILSSIFHSRVILYVHHIFGITSMNFGIIGKLVILYSEFVKYFWCI